MKLNYDTIPIKTLITLLNDESKLSDYGITKEEWDSFSVDYKDKNLSDSGKVLLEEFKKYVKSTIELSKLKILYDFIKINSDWKEAFKRADIKYTGDYKKDIEYLKKRIQKAITNEDVFKARFKKLEKELSELESKKPKTNFTVDELNKSIAGLEIHLGITIPNYETLTAGRFDALNEVSKDKIKNSQK